jgi:lysophospholipase L1-like esterase
MIKTILFQGDSITDGGRGREEDIDNPLGRNYPNLIAGKLGYQKADSNIHFVNKGISGNRVSDLYARWNEDAIHLKPDVLSILIGVNDAWRIVEKLPSGVTDRFERAYRHLLEETREVLPDTHLILCEPFILRVGSTEKEWGNWRRILDHYGQTVQALAVQYHAVFVPLQQAFNKAAERADNSYWLWDGVHPTPAGNELISTEWLKAVGNSPLSALL